MLHLYWPSMIYENEHSEDEECGCNTCGDLDCNVLDTIYEVTDLDGTSTRWHRTPLKERQRLYEARWTKYRSPRMASESITWPAYPGWLAGQ